MDVFAASRREPGRDGRAGVLARGLLWLGVSWLGLVGAGHALAAPRDTGASVAEPEPILHARAHIYRLRMHHLHTGESIDVAYRRNDEELPGGMEMLDHFLRDHRTDEEADYPVEEFDLLHALMEKLHKPNGLIEIVCGYRSEASNEYLRSLSAETGVAEHSQHVLSKAIDIRVPGVSTAKLRDAALSLEMGGVGYYPRSGFVHVDVGPVRQWQYGEEPVRRVRGRRGGRTRSAVLSRAKRSGLGKAGQGKTAAKSRTVRVKSRRRG